MSIQKHAIKLIADKPNERNELLLKSFQISSLVKTERKASTADPQNCLLRYLQKYALLKPFGFNIYKHNLVLPKANMNISKSSAIYLWIKNWNMLPSELCSNSKDFQTSFNGLYLDQLQTV